MEKKKLERLDAKIFRRLSQEETKRVRGAFTGLTDTVCSYFKGKVDGDTFEC